MAANVRRCENCGATVRLPDETLSLRCAFCDSPLVDVNGDEEPVERVVSFTVERERAARALRRYLAGRWFAPESVRKATSPSSLRSVLVPFYAFDAETETRFSATVGIHWWRTEHYTAMEGGKSVQKTRRVQETDWHDLSGSHKGQWFDHLVSASRGLSDTEMRGLAPYDLGRSVPWSAARVAGLEAERPMIDHATAEASARQSVRDRAETQVRERHLPGDVTGDVRCRTKLELSGFRLVLLPVWIAVVPSPHGELRLLVNGQTGQTTGEVPTSWRKVGLLMVLGLVLMAVLVGLGGSG
ncbi:MAG: hypothetical protein AAGA48_30650 [Myxococcota bacterium]